MEYLIKAIKIAKKKYITVNFRRFIVQTRVVVSAGEKHTSLLLKIKITLESVLIVLVGLRRIKSDYVV